MSNIKSFNVFVDNIGDDLTSGIISENFTILANEQDSVFNQSSCNYDYIPDIQSYLDALQGYGVGMIVYGAITVTIIICISLSSMIHVIQHGQHKSSVIFILSTYPVVSIALLSSLIIPRASVLAEALAQCMFSLSLYQLFCLFISYTGGETQLIRTTKPDALNLKVGPCCCYPCCQLPVLTANKKNLRVLRVLVLQLPVVQVLVYMIFLFTWADQKNYVVQDIYIQPILVCSILFGVWGITMTVRMLESRLENHKLVLKFLSLQCILLFTKLQGVIVKIVLFFDVIPCNPPITPALYAAIVFNSIVLLEIVVITFWARHLYQTPLPVVETLTNDVQQVLVEDRCMTNAQEDNIQKTDKP